MFCTSCGTQLPDEANFCWKCGMPQKEGLPEQGDRWETCEIDMVALTSSYFGKWEWQFVAAAIGPQGRYIAGESQVFKLSVRDKHLPDKQVVAILDTLISKLASEGWDPQEDQSGSWWRYRFRRRVRV